MHRMSTVPRMWARTPRLEFVLAGQDNISGQSTGPEPSSPKCWDGGLVLGVGGRALPKVAGAIMGSQKRLDARAHLAVGTRCLQKSQPLHGIFLDDLKKKLFYAGSL